jgi:hypothetical protein
MTISFLAYITEAASESVSSCQLWLAVAVSGAIEVLGAPHRPFSAAVS